MEELEILPSGLKEIVNDQDSGLEVRIYYLECLAQATYIIAHEGKAFIVDPRRDVDTFIQELNALGAKLIGILETHFHADFVSGHNELMQRTQAPIYFGPTAGPRCQFPHHELKDEEIIQFSSRYSIKVLHTPGHTPEAVVYLLIDTSNSDKPIKAFTGDTLFIGSCGRPDLVGSVGFTAGQMARMMFETLRSKISTLPSDVQVYPAHGAGSPCGKNLSTDLYSTIGKEMQTNPALKFTDEDEFIKFLTDGQPVAPGYFSHDVAQNTAGALPLSEVLSKIPRLTNDQFKLTVDNNTADYTVIDTRNPEEYNAGYIKGSLNFPLGESGGAILRPEDGNFAIWVGTLLQSDRQLLLIAKPGKEGEALQRLARIGYTNVKGILKNGMTDWIQSGYPVHATQRIDIRPGHGTSLQDLVSNGYNLIDVRTKQEYEGNTVKGSHNLPLNEIYKHLEELDKSKRYLAFCSTGYRSIIAISILRASGINAVDVFGGFAAASVYAPDLTISGKVCPAMKSMIDKLEAA